MSLGPNTRKFLEICHPGLRSAVKPCQDTSQGRERFQRPFWANQGHVRTGRKSYCIGVTRLGFDSGRSLGSMEVGHEEQV